jgi:phosphatidylserine/phosphatidylglycerophosphate/cardiolipin synthase-like enzyme
VHRPAALLVLAAMLVPTASGVTVDLAAPEAVPLDGTPVAADVEIADASGPVEVKAWVGSEDWQASRTWNGTAFQRSDHYALAPDASDGRWQGRVWVKANPSSSNADRLAATDERRLGVRLRDGGDRATALAPVDELATRNASWALAGPERSVEVREDDRTVAVLGSPDERRPIRVPAPSDAREICAADACGAELGWRMIRVGEGEIVLERANTTDTDAGAGGVLLADGRACPLPASPPEGQRWHIELARLLESDRCRDARGTPAAARLVVRGAEAQRVPERPGRGDVVRDPVTGGWAPWRLPSGIDPAPVDTMHVEGAAKVFATAEEGYEVVDRALAEARERVTVTSYLLTSEAVTERLVQAAERGVDVHLWLEPDPVGGRPEATQGLVERLRAHGVAVHDAAGPTEAGLQHAKVVVVDSSLVLVLTENLTEHGLPTGGETNQGLGIGVANASLAARVEATFREPLEGREIRPDGWRALDAPVAVLTAPENAWRREGVPAWLAETSGPVEGAVLRANPRWGPRSNAWLEAMVDHSRNASVDLLFSGAPEGAARSNREAIAHLQAHPDARDVDARLSDPRAGTLHAKTIVAPDGLLVGSTNWGLGGVLLNREVNLLVHDDRLADRARAIVDTWGDAETIEPPAVQAVGREAAALVLAGVLAAWVSSRRTGWARSRRR